MKFGIKRKHSLANKYSIDEWVSLQQKRMVGFVLENNNQIYFDAQELSQSYSLNEDFPQLRDEVVNTLIEDLNLNLGFNEVKIEQLLEPEKRIEGGYKISDLFFGIYTNNLDSMICELFFDEFEHMSKSENDINNLLLDLTFRIGKINISKLENIVKNVIYEIKPEFKVISCGEYLFDYVLGVEEVMVVMEDEIMNIEDNIGVSLAPNEEDISIDLDVVLGTIQMPISDLKELLVGDFINIESLAFTNVEIRYRNKKIAMGEIIYNEDDKLSIEINEVFL